MATIENFATVNYTSGGVAQTKVSNLAEIGLESAVTLSKNSLDQTYDENSVITHIITITNTSASAVNDLVVTDNLGTFLYNTTELTPLVYSAPSLLLINGQDNTAQLTVDDTQADSLVFSFPSLPAGATANIIYKAEVNEFAPLALGSSIVNTATLESSSDCASATASETIEVDENANVSVFKQMTPNPVVCGETVTYTIRIYNYGNIPAENVQLTDAFDPAPTILSITRDGTALATTDYSYNAGTLTIPETGGTTTVTVPAATFTNDATTGAVIVTPGVVEYVITGTI